MAPLSHLRYLCENGHPSNAVVIYYQSHAYA